GELRDEVDHMLMHPPHELAEFLDPELSGRIWTSFQEDGCGWLRPWSLYALGRWVTSLNAAPMAVS
ncbi:MAG TPA: hypothetical protein VM690_03180, partial [Gaiellaceae bacterium]|nr:hypothetical protein [Gaiellaceae bacterium]